MMFGIFDEIKKLAYGITDSNEDQGCLKIIKKALRKNKEQASHLLWDRNHNDFGYQRKKNTFLLMVSIFL